MILLVNNPPPPNLIQRLANEYKLARQFFGLVTDGAMKALKMSGNFGIVGISIGDSEPFCVHLDCRFDDPWIDLEMMLKADEVVFQAERAEDGTDRLIGRVKGAEAVRLFFDNNGALRCSVPDPELI